MATLRPVDPATLLPNPDNPRRVPATPAQEGQLRASIAAVGIIQPPRVVERDDGRLVINAGGRRAAAAVALGLNPIDVLVCTPEEAADAMRAAAENLVRVTMSSVDIWRAIHDLEGRGWTDGAIADALALRTRDVRRLKLLARIHPPMLEVMAAGSMPSEEQLRAIAAAAPEEQAQVWKKHKPKRDQPTPWSTVAHALSKRRMPRAAARFGDDLAADYGVAWEEDLFAPADQDGRYTTNVEGFLAAQQQWLRDNLPAKNATILPVDDHGVAKLPKGAERVRGRPGRGTTAGHLIDPRTGAVEVVHYAVPGPRKPAGPAKGSGGTPVGDAPGLPRATRPEISQKGVAMIGMLRTDALREAVLEAPLGDAALMAMLVIALGAPNVSVQSPVHDGPFARRDGAARLAEGGELTADAEAIRRAARETLARVLSLREDATSSGPLAIVAGAAAGADARLPNMATEEFLSCLSKAALERAAAAEGIPPKPTGRETRAAMVRRLANGRWVHPRALFAPTEDERAKLARAREDAGPPVPCGGDGDDLADEGGPAGDGDGADEPAAIAAR